MTSVDSGVETGNDSNDSSTVQHEGQQGVYDVYDHASSSHRSTCQWTTFERTNIKWPTQIEPLNWMPLMNLNFEKFREDYNRSLLEKNLISPGAAMLSLPVFCHDEKHSTPHCSSHPLTFLKFEDRQDKTDFQGKLRAHLCRKTIHNWRTLQNERKMRLAAATNNIILMRRLLNLGTSPNCFDCLGRTPLHHAAGRGYTELVRILLENGANPNQRDCIGNTPLHLAAVASKISVVTLLIEAGTDINLLDKYGYNPLQLAQTKLRIFQDCKDGDMARVKEEMRNIVDMLLAYFEKQEKNTQEQMEMLSNFCSRLSLSSTSDQVQSDVKDLLMNINALSITS